MYLPKSPAIRKPTNRAPVVPTSNLRMRPQAAQQGPQADLSRKQGPGPQGPAGMQKAPTTAQPPAPAPGGQLQTTVTQNTTNPAVQTQIDMAAKFAADKKAVLDQSQRTGEQAQVDNMARLGASGFGTSGALAATGANIRTDQGIKLAGALGALEDRQFGQQRQVNQDFFQEDQRQRGNAREDADQQARLEAANAAAGGFVDVDKNGKDDTSGLTEQQFGAGNGLRVQHAEGGRNVGDTVDPFSAMWYATQTPGGQSNPFLLNSAEFANIASYGFRQVGTDQRTGQPVYQDPASGDYYVYVEGA